MRTILAFALALLSLPALAAGEGTPLSVEVVIAVIEKGLVVLLPLVLLVVPFAVRALLGLLSRQDRERLLAATKGAVLIVGEVSRHTKTTLDDSLVLVLRHVEAELGKPLSAAQAVKVKGIALALHADSRFPARLGPGAEAFDLLRVSSLAKR